tara:strand:- start:28747 stop:28992 length:246 start_codon:yes stop_codon:yes gene_type:complete
MIGCTNRNANCYSKLGNSCLSQTKAYTSNTKFYSPTNPIYWWNYVPIHYPDGNKYIINNGYPFSDNKLLLGTSCINKTCIE